MIANNKQDIVELRKNQQGLNDQLTPMMALQSISIHSTELCNRTCYFCPRSDPKIYPNQNLHISEDTIRRLSSELKLNNYTNRVGWSGNGEPLLTKDFYKLAKIISDENPQLSVHEIITNGDKIKPAVILLIHSKKYKNDIIKILKLDNLLIKKVLNIVPHVNNIKDKFNKL